MHFMCYWLYMAYRYFFFRDNILHVFHSRLECWIVLAASISFCFFFFFLSIIVITVIVIVIIFVYFFCALLYICCLLHYGEIKFHIKRNFLWSFFCLALALTPKWTSKSISIHFSISLKIKAMRSIESIVSSELSLTTHFHLVTLRPN